MVLATNTFIDVPIVLQYEDTPLIQFVKEEAAGFDASGDALRIGSNIVMQGNTFSGCRIGIWAKREGFSLGVS